MAWCWEASTTSGLHIKQIADASVSASTAVAHGNAAGTPDFLIVKQLASQSWYVWHKSLATTEYLALEDYAAKGTGGAVFNGIDATNFTTGSWSGWNTSTDWICYSWVGITGFSHFGYYKGTTVFDSGADGPFAYTGFRPAFLLIKRTDSAGAWQIYDNLRSTYNPNGTLLYADTNEADAADTANIVDFLSNGFKVRGTGGNTNANTSPYIFAAFAEHPFPLNLRAE